MRTRHHTNIQQSRACGFTLIEVLVALVVLSTGIVAVLRALDTATVALGEARDSLQATLLMEKKLAEASAAAAAERAELSAGSFSESFLGAPWRGAWDVEAGLPGGVRVVSESNALVRVRISVSRAGGAVHSRETYLWESTRP
jgi:type II secretion system protein I